MAITENPSYRARTGTVTIGTETFTITQEGRPASECEFSIDPISTMASVNGANGHIAVTATPGLWIYLPVLIAISVVTGCFTGLCAQAMLNRGDSLWKTIFR